MDKNQADTTESGKTKGVTPYGVAKKNFFSEFLFQSGTTKLCDHLFNKVRFCFLKFGVHENSIYLTPSQFLIMSPRLRKTDPNMKGKDMEDLWKASGERAELLAGMSQSEIKRRRYDQ